MRSFIRLFLLILVLFTVGCVQKENKQKIISDPVATESQEQKKPATRPANSVLAPDFTLQTINGKIVSLNEFMGKVIILNFWATWCFPCRMEIPDFNELYKKYSDKGLEILGISISDTKDQLVNFLKAYTIDYPVLYGNQIDMQKIIMDYGGVYSIPMSFLIGKNNEIKRVYPGAILKQYDPNMYSDLIYTIEASLVEEHKVDNILIVPNE